MDPQGTQSASGFGPGGSKSAVTPADSHAKCIESPGYWALAFAFKALPVAFFTADLLSIYFCAVRLIRAVSTFM